MSNLKTTITFLLALVTAFVLIVFLNFGIFENWQNRLSDNLFIPRKTLKQIVILAIDDKSLQKIGRWPWDRKVFAQIIDKLNSSYAVLGLDVSFFEKSNQQSDDHLKEVLSKNPNIVLAAEAGKLKIEDNKTSVAELLTPLSDFVENTKYGLVNVVVDPDGIVRNVAIDAKDENNDQINSFPLQIVKSYYKNNQTPVVGGLVKINFVGKPNSFITYSISDFLDGKLNNDLFKNKIVLIGATALDLHDNGQTAVSKGALMSGVEIHANSIQMLLEKRFLSAEPVEFSAASVVFLCLLLSFIMGKFNIFLSSFSLLFLLALYFIYSFISFDKGIIRNLIYAPLGLMVVFVETVIYKYLTESKQKRFIKKAFSYYLSSDVLEEVLKDPKQLVLGGKRQQLSILFSDIEGFTTISESLDPEKLSKFLNFYLTQMTESVFENKGVLDKYIGDAVMAFWGAPIDNPQHALLACKSALLMQQKVLQLQDSLQKFGLDKLNIRIGINSGEVVVGNMGSDRRFDYTVLGDNVNLASRLEGLNKIYQTKILISQFTYSHVKDHVVARFIDTVAVLGKHSGISIYQLIDLGKPLPKQLKWFGEFDRARIAYQEKKFKKAKKMFEILWSNYDDQVAKVYMERCQEYINNPPKSWDGIYYATEK